MFLLGTAGLGYPCVFPLTVMKTSNNPKIPYDKIYETDAEGTDVAEAKHAVPC